MTKLRVLSLTNGANDGKEGLTTPFSRTYASVPAFNDISPMICGNSYRADKICEFLIGNSLNLADMKWKLSLGASPMCECGESEETPFHFFLNCKLQSANRPNNCTNLNVFNQDDCVKLTTHTKLEKLDWIELCELWYPHSSNVIKLFILINE